MNEINLKKELKRCYLFKRLSDEEIDRIAAISIVREMPKKNLIFSEGEESIGFYIVVKGLVKLFNLSNEGKEDIIQMVKTGEPFAYAACFAEGKHYCFSETKQKSTLIYIPIFQFREVILKESEIALKMLATLSNQIIDLERMLKDSHANEVIFRVACFFMKIIPEGISKSDLPLELKFDLSKSQLASKLCTTTDVISSSFTRLKNLGIMDVKGKKVILYAPDKFHLLSNSSDNS